MSMAPGTGRNNVDHWIIAPVVLPALAGAVLVMLRLRLAVQRMLGLAATIGLVAI